VNIKITLTPRRQSLANTSIAQTLTITTTRGSEQRKNRNKKQNLLHSSNINENKVIKKHKKKQILLDLPLKVE
jgi:hypothetical protein